MFPARVRLTGPDERDEAVRAYLHTALERMRALNARKVVLGSSGARNLPEGMTHAEGVKQLSRVVGEVIAPMLDEYEIQLVMEPIGRGEANFIRTLPEGMEIVRAEEALAAIHAAIKRVNHLPNEKNAQPSAE